MIAHFDHVTIVVNDVESAKSFFALLGFAEQQTVVISGDKFSTYMGVADIEAEHVTLALSNASPRLEIQLLHYRHPDPIQDPNVARLNKIGFNHICLAVDDIDAEVAKLSAHGIKMRNEIMQFHDRKLVFISGPEGVTVELAEWAKH
ncbi:MAG TPA: VOC family protein [Stellaceae bacterium]|jgi:catechol 2,3-dioxygenase-like lactoylglutathione lyase family enzyme|nr:VOC family protein [Stellaceae bacterium]